MSHVAPVQTQAVSRLSHIVRPLPRTVLHGIALSGGCLLGGLALLLLARRLEGGLVEPLPAPVAAVASLSLAGSAVIVRTAGLLAWLTHRDRLERWLAWTLFLLPGLACYIAAVAISLPQTTAAADAWLYLPLSLVEVGSLALGAWVIRHSDRGAQVLSWFGNDPLKSPMVRRPEMKVPRLAPAGDTEALPDGVTQRLVRRRLPNGQDTYQGTLRVEFTTGQRTEVLHVAFCPPFDIAPQWTAKVVKGPALTIKQVQVFPYGARLEVRLNQLAAAAVDSQISFSAVASQTLD